MNYHEVVKALRLKLEYVPAAAQKFKHNINFSSDVFSSDFENTVCGYVDALAEVKKIKSINKRAVLIYSAMGFYQDEIADMLRVNQSTICRHLKWLRNYFS